MDGSFLNRFEENGTAVFKRGSDNAGRFNSNDARIERFAQEGEPFYVVLPQRVLRV